MRIAVISDVHGNLPALEAVLADLAQARPDVVVHGGDLALGGPHPVEVVDRIRELGWPGVVGNADGALVDDGQVEHRRVAYDVERVAADLHAIGYPHAATYEAWLKSGSRP